MVVLRSEATVHTAVCGVLECNSGRSKVRSQHLQAY